MKSLVIVTMVSLIGMPAYAEEEISPFDLAKPGAGAAAVGLGVHSIYKDGKTIAAEKENIAHQQKYITPEKKAELDELESKRVNFIHDETEEARERFRLFEEQRSHMAADRLAAQIDFEEQLKAKEAAAKEFNRRRWHYPEAADWKYEPELRAATKKVKEAREKLEKLPVFPEDVYQKELEKLKIAKAEAELKWREKFPEESARLEKIRNLYTGAKNSVARSEKEIAKKVLTRRLKAGFIGLGAAAGGAYLLGESSSVSVIESQDFKGKRAPAIVPESHEKAELVMPGI